MVCDVVVARIVVCGELVWWCDGLWCSGVVCCGVRWRGNVWCSMVCVWFSSVVFG